ncbi:hypothetical protein EKK58_04395 [Candidatus Dependentiae bacterium]|nr:MAG: hypothetical protein EKK58_04395 [Candidatus Dependentiae bacterium]
MNFPTKEERIEMNKYFIYCSICNKKVSYEGFFNNHLSTKIHTNNVNKIQKDEYENIVNKIKKIKKDNNEEHEDNILNNYKILLINNKNK